LLVTIVVDGVDLYLLPLCLSGKDRLIGKIKAAFRSELRGNKAVGAAGVVLAGSDIQEDLSKREHEVLGLQSRHLTNKEIAGKLFISPETVKLHAQSIYQKLSVGSRRDAVAKASGLGILPRN
jgi:ATP/maltotriose-dependent transcriptional regulator MalT